MVFREVPSSFFSNAIIVVNDTNIIETPINVYKIPRVCGSFNMVKFLEILYATKPAGITASKNLTKSKNSMFYL